MIDEKIISISDKEKLEYLEELLENDIDFKVKFIKYFNLKNQMEKTYKNKDLESLIEEIFILFNDADTELYFDALRCSNNGYYGYYEEDISNELCEGLYIELEKQLNMHLRQDDFYQVLFILFAISKAINLGPSVDDQYGLIYDYEEILSDYHYSLISKFNDKLQKSDLSFENIKKLIMFLLDNSENPEELKIFEETFDCLIKSKEVASYFSNRILEFHINIQLKIINLLNDDKLYIKSAKEFYKKDVTIAKKLLKKLDELSLYEDYETIAKECFNEDKSYFVSDIFEVIKYEKSKDFYLELLRYKVLNNYNLNEYILYKKYLSTKELENLQNEICSGANKNYCIEILNYEKKYDTILELAKNTNYNLEIYIESIKFHFPQECLNLIIKKCNNLLSSPDRNRESYKRMCELIKTIKDVKGIENEIDSYIKTLINRKPRLPALKDELSKSGLL